MTRSNTKSSTHTETPLKKIPKSRKNNRADNISWLLHCYRAWMKDPGAAGIWQTFHQGDRLFAGYWALRAKVHHGQVRPADLTELAVSGQGELQLRPDLYPLYEEFLLTYVTGPGPIFGLTRTEIAGYLGFAHHPALTPTGFWAGYEQHMRKQLAAFERHNVLDRPGCSLTQLGVMATATGELRLDDTFALWKHLLFRTSIDYELLKQVCPYATFLQLRSSSVSTQTKEAIEPSKQVAGKLEGLRAWQNNWARRPVWGGLSLSDKLFATYWLLERTSELEVPGSARPSLLLTSQGVKTCLQGRHFPLFCQFLLQYTPQHPIGHGLSVSDLAELFEVRVSDVHYDPETSTIWDDFNAHVHQALAPYADPPNTPSLIQSVFPIVDPLLQMMEGWRVIVDTSLKVVKVPLTLAYWSARLRGRVEEMRGVEGDAMSWSSFLKLREQPPAPPKDCLPRTEAAKPSSEDQASKIAWLNRWFTDVSQRTNWGRLPTFDRVFVAYVALHTHYTPLKAEWPEQIEAFRLLHVVTWLYNKTNLRPDQFPLFVEFLKEYDQGETLAGVDEPLFAEALGLPRERLSRELISVSGFWLDFLLYAGRELEPFTKTPAVEGGRPAEPALRAAHAWGVVVSRLYGTLKLSETKRHWTSLLRGKRSAGDAIPWSTFLEIHRTYRLEEGGVQGDAAPSSPPTELPNEPSSSRVESGTKGGDTDLMPGVQVVQGIKPSPSQQQRPPSPARSDVRVEYVEQLYPSPSSPSQPAEPTQVQPPSPPLPPSSPLDTLLTRLFPHPEDLAEVTAWCREGRIRTPEVFSLLRQEDYAHLPLGIRAVLRQHFHHTKLAQGIPSLG